jgi:hypothetical protein
MGNDHNDDPRRWPDGVETYPADVSRYDRARQQLAQFQAPQLASPPNGRVFVACFDGTWNDKDKFPGKTNVADIYEQLKAVSPTNLGFGYQPGVGNQDDWIRQKADGAFGYSYGPRMEQMYYDFCVKSKEWLEENPNAQISVDAVGFSRGGPTAAMFTRLVHERGIQNPEGMVIERDAEGNIQSLTPTQPSLVPPGKTPQVVGLFDPVATGIMNLDDTRLPPSVVSGFQITALDERRDVFLSKQIIDPGLSADGRFLAVQVAGAHSDVGGGYLLNGLPVRNGNMMVAYLNSTFDRPVLQERPVPTAPEMNVIHRSEQGALGYTPALASVFGERQVTEDLAGLKIARNHKDAEPVDRALLEGLRYRQVQVGPQREDPALPDFFRDRPQMPVKEVYDFSGPRPQREPSAPAPNYVVPGAQPKPLIEMPDYLQPDQKPAARGAEDIPTLETVQVRPGPELTQGISTPPQSQAQTSTPTIPDRARIASLQSDLIQLGYHHRISQPLQANGVNDEATRQAVTAFQARNDLPINGIADQSTQQAMQQALLTQQLQPQAFETREREQDRKAEQDALARNGSRDHTSLRPFSDPNHPQHALYASLEQRFQAKGHTLSEEQLSALTGQMHSAGAKPGWQGDVVVHNGQAFAQAAWPPGMRATLDLQAPAPSVQDTMKDFQADQQSMALNMERLNQQQATAQEHGHGLSR